MSTTERTFDRDDGVWDVVAHVDDCPPEYRGFGRAEHCIDAQAMALRALADVLAGPR